MMAPGFNPFQSKPPSKPNGPRALKPIQSSSGHKIPPKLGQQSQNVEKSIFSRVSDFFRSIYKRFF